MKLCGVIVTFSLCFLTGYVVSIKWPQHEVLDDKGRFHLYWKPPAVKEGNSEILFKIEVAAKGYVGFGLSPNGYMPGSDIITGWVKHGQVYFQDRHADGRNLPIIDEKQDWILMHARENRTHTILQFRRKLDTCDENDVVIDGSTMRVIYAFSDKDPKADAPFYHFKNRGWKSIILLRESVSIPQDPDMLHWDVQAPNYDVSPYETIYWCKIFKSPKLHKKHHIVHVRPLIQKGHGHFVHHMVLYECVDGTPADYEGLLDSDGFDCYGQYLTMPEPLRRCEGSTIVWAMGGGDIILPEEAGIPLERGPGRYYRLEIHYDNPQLMQGFFDNSGYRIFYTPNLRKYDASTYGVGSSLPRMFMPPNQQSYVVAGHGAPDCLDPVMPRDGITFTGIFLHTHLITSKVIARHFRGQKELPPIARDDNYDYRYQKILYYKEGIKFMPGDQITVECTYNTSTRNTVTFGGETTRDEMCLVVILYYPKVERRYTSMSVPTFAAINNALDTNFKEESDVYSLFYYNWTNVNIKDVENSMRFSEHDSQCVFGNGEMETSLISYPSHLEPYIQPDSTCRDFSERKMPWIRRH